MRKADLEKLYSGWENEKLVAAFKNRNEYTGEALEAMLSVLKERGLSEFADKEIVKEKVEKQEWVVKEKANLEQQQKNYEAKMLGENTGAKEFAAKSLVNGEYMSGKLASSSFKWLRTMCVSLLSVSLILAVFTIFEGKLFKYAFETSAILTFFFASSFILLFKKAKAQYKFSRIGNRDEFEIESGSYSFKATLPFQYFATYRTVEYRRGAMKISHPVLHLIITNKENETISLSGNLTALESPPPAWPGMFDTKVPKGTRFFNEVVGHRVNIIKLKKILDGLGDGKHGMN